MTFERTQLRRLLTLDERIRRGLFPNANTFAREWEVSRRTVLRDLDLLRDLGAPLEYDAERRGYRYAGASWRMPALDLSEGELLQLSVAQLLAEQYRGTPLAAHLDGLFAKLRAALPQPVRVDPALVSGLFSFHGQPVRRVNEKTWTTLARAVRERRAVSAEYRGYGKGKPKSMELEPVHICCVEGEWYLVARAVESGALRHYAVSRFAGAQVLRRTFGEVAFDPAKYFAHRFGRFIGKAEDEARVAVKFSADEAEGVCERRWHARQDLEVHRDGSVTLSFPAPRTALYAIKRWVLQWGRKADVLEPAELRAEVRAELGLAREGRRQARA